MGNSGCKPVNPTQMKNDPGDNINEILTIKNSCGPKLDAKRYLNRFIPKNGEYVFVEENENPMDCGYCWDTTGTPSVCSTGCLPGQVGAYKRIGYKADKHDCCLQVGSSVIGEDTCAVGHRGPLAKDCKTLMTNKIHLKEFDIFHDPAAELFCADPLNHLVCHEEKKRRCYEAGPNMEGDCISWCIKNGGDCDVAMTLYCGEPKNANKPECTCINTIFDQKASIVHNPLCADLKCIKSGYATTSMIEKSFGCKQVTCDVYFNVRGASKVDINHNKVVQTCTGDSKTHMANGNDEFITIPHNYSTKFNRTYMDTVTAIREFIEEYWHAIIPSIAIFVMLVYFVLHSHIFKKWINMLK